MRMALIKLNETWAGKDDRMKLSIGVGVNHGEVVVGNIGHPDFRMEFTVLGDGVNLAARLESATKQFKTDILIGEEAEKLTRDHFVFRRVGAIAFKGKTKPVEVYFLLSDKSQMPPAWLTEYHEAVSLYRQRCFEQAAGKFKSVKEQIGEDDHLCQMYLAGCEENQNRVLLESWDGSFALTEK
jgi:adenylate cyclase